MIKINYDPNGKVENIHIQINDYFALIPWNPDTKLIDWDSIDYQPTRDSIKSAWDSWAEGKDLSVELRDRPDLIPPPPPPPVPQPNWSKFNREFLIDSGYLRIVSQCPVPVVMSRLESLCMSANQSTDIIGETWNTIINTLSVKPSATEINSWNKLAKENYMNFHFGYDGTLTIDS